MATNFSNPFPRFFNDNSALLISGRLNFFEPDGSSTRKPTFTDFTLSAENSNPVILSKGAVAPSIVLNGTYRVTLESRDSEGKFTQIDEANNVGEAGGVAFSDWAVGVDYGIGGDNIVTGSDGRYYVSLLTPNLGNDPTISPTFWEEIRFLGIYNVNIAYEIGDVVQETDGLMWKSLIDPNTGNTPNSSPAAWESVSRDTITTGITASTTQTQAAATALIADINEISVCANSSDSVKLKAAGAALSQTIINNGAEKAQIFPLSGDDIDGGGVDAADSNLLDPGNTRTYTATDGTNWVTLGEAAGGGGLTATEVTSAVDIALTTLSDNVQVVTMTNPALSVTEPDATTLPDPAATVTERVISADAASDSFLYKDNGGGVLTSIAAGEKYRSLLIDNGTAAGAWSVGKYEGLAEIFLGASFTDSESENMMSTATIDGTRGIVIWTIGTSVKLQVINLDGTSGAIVTPSSSIILDNQPSVTMLTSTVGLAAYVNSGTTQLGVTYFTVSGDAITLGNSDASTFSTGEIGNTSISRLDDTSALQVGYDTGVDLVGTVVTVSGNTPTMNAEVVLVDNGAFAQQQKAMQVIGTGALTAVVVFKDSSNDVASKNVTITGTTPAGGSQTTLIASITSRFLEAVSMGDNVLVSCVDSSTSPDRLITRAFSLSSGHFGSSSAQFTDTVTTSLTHITVMALTADKAVVLTDADVSTSYNFVDLTGGIGSMAVGDFTVIPGLGVIETDAVSIGKLDGSKGFLIDGPTSTWSEIFLGASL